MFKPLAAFLGLRYTRAEKSNRFISFIALISMIGLALGVAVLITVMSVMNGFDRELRTRILGMIPQASVSGYELIPDWKALAKEAETQPHVQAAAPFTQLQGMLTANGQVAGVVATGIVPKYEQKVSIIANHLKAGDINQISTGSYNIALGESLTQALGLQLGDKVTLVLPEASASAAGIIPRFKRFTLVAVFSISPEVDNAMAYVALNDAAKLLRLPAGAQGIRMKLDDIFAAPKVANNFAQKYPHQLYPTDWTQTHGNLFGAIQMEKAMVGLLLFLIVLVAAFNIVSSLVMVVTDKKSDIAILKTMGASPKLIRRTFMVQGALIGVIGTVIGTVLGVLVALNVSQIFQAVNEGFNLHLLDAYFINYLPSQLLWTDVAKIVTTSLLLSFLATIYPAHRASKINPAETLRYE